MKQVLESWSYHTVVWLCFTWRVLSGVMPLIAFIFRLFLFATDYTELVSNYDYVQITVGYMILWCVPWLLWTFQNTRHIQICFSVRLLGLLGFFTSSSSCVASAISPLPMTGQSRGGHSRIRSNFTEKEGKGERRKNLIETFSQWFATWFDAGLSPLSQNR